MKHSIEKIFKNLNLYLLIILTLTTISFLFIVEQYYSYKKVDNLSSQKVILFNLLEEQKQLKHIDIIQFNASIAKLNHATKNLYTQNQYNYISLYLLNHTQSYIVDLNTLSDMTKTFDTQSREYLKIIENNKKTNLIILSLENTHEKIASFIDSMLIKNISYDKKRFDIFSLVFILLFILLLITTFWYKKRLRSIHDDILFLYAIDGNKNAEIFSQEVDAISLRMKRKTQISDNPAMVDPITEIPNNKGMLQAYSERKGIKDSSFSSVSILEIDNFSKSKRTFSQEFTQDILKKVAYTISLHQQATDVIARSDYNQFTLIFSRTSKEQLYKHTDLIRQSISELKLSSPEKEIVNITVTGAFINKANHAPLEESIRKAKELLQSARHLGNNKIFQTKDLPK